MQQISWLYACLRGMRKSFWIAMSMAIVSSLLYMALPFITKKITDEVLVGQLLADGTVLRNVELLPAMLAALMISQLLRSADRYMMIVTLENTSQNMLKRLRLEIFTNLLKQDASFYDEYRTGDIMTRLTGDIDFVRHMVSWLSFSIVESSSLFILANIYFFTINTKLALILLAATPLLMFSTYFYSRSVYPLYATLREKLSGMNSIAQENIEGNKIVRTFAREDFECKKFDEANKDFYTANLKASFHWLKFFPFIEGFSQSLNIMIILFGGLFIIAGQMTPGELMAFSLLSWGVSGPMRDMGMYLNDLQRFFASANKVMEIHSVKTRIQSPKDGRKQSEPAGGSIVFENVSYRYEHDQAYAVKNINLSIGSGETVAIMGSTGSGKTTLINAISRVFDVTSGRVLVDGTDTRDWDLKALRSNIGVATQDVLLYSNTVDANIAYANPDMPEGEVQYYAELAAAQFVEKLPNQYQTIIGERGTGLSGGQKQRISLARALAAKPKILILDDVTSAVDMETERYIQESLQKLPYKCTKIIIAQRISSVRHADKIVVMADGEISECGTHDELLAKGGFYRDICELQGIEVSAAKEMEQVGGKK